MIPAGESGRLERSIVREPHVAMAGVAVGYLHSREVLLNGHPLKSKCEGRNFLPGFRRKVTLGVAEGLS